jgi:hypothetical protein
MVNRLLPASDAPVPTRDNKCPAHETSQSLCQGVAKQRGGDLPFV